MRAMALALPSDQTERSQGIPLPSVPTHIPTGIPRPAQLSREEETRITIDEKIQSDDEDDNDGDYEEESKKKRKRGRDKKKEVASQVSLLVDQLQLMQRQGRSETDCFTFLSSINWTDKKLFDFKLALTGLMQVSNKSASATETAMMKYLTGLQNDHPDSLMADQCREMAYPSLQKATLEIEEQIFEAERELKKLKNSLKIHKFFLEVHQEQTHDRCSLMAWLFQKMAELESRRFLEVASKTSARKEFGRRSGGGREV
jgi:hypothetical protein